MKIVSIIGTRPQFIKVDAIDSIINDNHIIINTGQHYSDNMSDNIIKSLRIKDKEIYNVGIKSGDYTYSKQMSLTIKEILKKIKYICPDFVFVYGDTNSTIAGAIASKKTPIKLVHIESGLRSHNIEMIEEINRILTDQMSDILCCPTKSSYDNLKEEGLNGYFVGDVMLDSIIHYSKEDYNKIKDDYILATIHRSYNIKSTEKINNILDKLNILGKKKRILIPIHPHTLKIQKQSNISLSKYKNIEFIDPVNYIDMISLIKNSFFVITDSGGVQKESFFLKKFCYVLRKETEWTDILDLGWSILIELDDIENIEFKEQPNIHDTSLFGDGHASEKILEIVKNNYIKQEI